MLKLVFNLVCYIFVAYYFLSFAGCKNKKIYQELSLEVNTFETQITSDYLNEYSKKIITKDLLIGYNHLNHSYDFFDLNSKKPIDQILLEREGPEGLFVSNFVVSDSVIITLSRRDLVYIGFDGEFLKRDYLGDNGLNFDTLSLKASMKYGNDAPPLCYMENDSKIYFDLFSYGNNFPTSIGYYDISESNFTILNALHFFSGEYGMLSDPEIVRRSYNSIVFYTHYSDSIFVLDLNNNSFSNLRLESEVSKGVATIAKSESLKANHNHYIANRLFGNLVFFENEKIYARVVNKYNPKSMFDRKDQYLCFFDEEGIEIVSSKLDSDVKPYLMKWNNELLMEIKNDTESTIRFMKVTFVKKVE